MSMFLCDRAEESSSYDFGKHGSDGIDIQQLFYLSDPLMHMATCDGDFHQRLGECQTASRIIKLSTLLHSIKMGELP
jgi:hypothetical protein